MCSFGFFLKKLVSAFLLPLPFSLAIIFVGLAFLWLTKKQWTGKIFVTVGAVLIFVTNLGIVSHITVLPLDQAYPVYQASKSDPVKFVVVLSGGAGFKNGIPMNTRGDYVTLSRLMEGLRVYRCNPGSKIILTGGPVCSRIPLSVIEAGLLMQLGIPKSDIILDTQSFDTSEEALNVKKIVKNEQFVLVTSVTHMTRALKLFKKQGMNPTPAPTGFMSNYSSILSFIPNSASSCSIDEAIHEYLGIIWSKIHKQL